MHRGYSPRRGGDRASPYLGPDAGVRGAPMQLGIDPVIGGRSKDDLADRRGMIEHEPELAPELACVEFTCAAQRDLLADGEQQLDPHLGESRRGRQPPGEPERHRDRRLVVRPEDPLTRVLPAFVHEYGLDRRRQRHGVQVSADQHAVGPAPGHPGQ